MKLAKYINKNRNEVSALKGIPVDKLKVVQEKVRTMIKVINHYSSIVEVSPRYVFRGPRRNASFQFGPKVIKKNSTLKCDAKTVSIYLNVKIKCPGISYEKRSELREEVIKNFTEML